MKISTFLETTRITRIHLDHDERFTLDHYSRGNPTDDRLLVDSITVTVMLADDQQTVTHRLEGDRLRRDGTPGASRIARLLDQGETTPHAIPSLVCDLMLNASRAVKA